MKGKVSAFHIGQKIELEEVNNSLSLEVARRELTFLLYKVGHESYVYVKDFGSVVFLNCPRHIEKEVFEVIRSCSDEVAEESISDSMSIEIFGDEFFKVEFNKVVVSDLNIDVAHVIMLNMAQSVALEFYFGRSEDLLISTSEITKEMEIHGRIGLSRKELRKYVGKTLNLKNRIAKNLFIFDTPQLAWSNEQLSGLDQKLSEEFDVLSRHRGIQHNLSVTKENLELFKDILQHKHSSILEWVIIILIMLELLHMIIK